MCRVKRKWTKFEGSGLNGVVFIAVPLARDFMIERKRGGGGREGSKNVLHLFDTCQSSAENLTRTVQIDRVSNVGLV